MSLTNFIPTPKFEEYRERFKECYTLDRRDDGVLLARAHTRGGSVKLSVEITSSVGQLFKTVGADPDNEVFIFSGTGNDFMMAVDPTVSSWSKKISSTGRTSMRTRTDASMSAP